MANDILITPVSASIQFSGSANASIKLTVDASGSLSITGNSGSLFSITDNLSGSLMSVNTIAGLPILEVFSDNRVNIGKYAGEAIKIQSGGSDVALGSGSVMFVTSSGRVGIGTTNPTNKLDVVGNISCSAITASLFSGAHTGSTFGTSSWANNALTAALATSINFTASNATTSQTASYLTPANSYSITNLNASGFITASTLLAGTTQVTNVGSTIAVLEVTGPANISGTFAVLASSGDNTASVFTVYGDNSPRTPRFTVSRNGNVGIGTTNPVNKLDVVGNISCSAITASLFFGTASVANALNTGNSYTITNLTASNISSSGVSVFNKTGFGTSSALSNASPMIDVSYGDYQNAGCIRLGADLGVNNSRTTNARKFGIISSFPYNNTSQSIFVIGADAQSTTVNAVNIGGGSGNMASPTRILFFTTSSIQESGTERMRIDGSGNVGIGTTSPNTLLNVGSGTPSTAANGIQFGSDTSANLYRISTGVIKTDGGLTVGNGAVNVYGANSGYIVSRRDNSTAAWQWYSQTGELRLYDQINAFDRLIVTTAGLFTFTSAISCSAITGSHFGTSSWATNALTAALATSINFTPANATNAVYATTAGTANTASYVSAGNVVGTVTSASYALSSSYAVSSSFTTTAATANALNVGNSYTIAGLTNNGALTMGSGYQILATQGTVGSPGYSFAGNTNSGLYEPSNNTLGFVTNGTERMTINTSGSVGIGTANPSYKLDVSGGDVNISSANILKFGTVNVLNTSGNANDIYANIRVLRNESTVTQDGMYINYNSNGGSAATLRFYANGVNERMRIDASNGNVGIGSVSPAAVLDVTGDARFTGNVGIGGLAGTDGNSNAVKLTLIGLGNTTTAMKFQSVNGIGTTSTGTKVFKGYIRVQIDSTVTDGTNPFASGLYYMPMYQ